ncbi:MAG: hypothetical protein PHF18_17440 [Methanosarcina sp.]|uniref:hypothetical protein n=1 Tax=Methanosarcina sp. TaxID=2213 RepID=UPI002624726A|nr:hypothetical protein [Methanosarcina sp.]MDD3248615.1 hypothetical protein [Methanosarcina sp.]
MSIVKEKPQLDLVLKTHPGVIGQEIEQKNRHDDAIKIYSCFKEFEKVNFETLNPKMNFSIQSGTYPIPPNTSTLSGKISGVEKSGLNPLQAAEKSRLNFNQLTESYSIVTGRAPELCSCPKAPEAPEARN